MPRIIQTHEEERKEEEHIHSTIGNNIKASLLTNIFYLATRLCIPPIVLAHVSLAEYGLWSYCFIILGYLGMGVFGITNVYVRYTATFFAHKKYLRINCLLSTGIISISLLCIALLTLMLLTIPWLLNVFNVDQDLRHTAFILFIGSTIIFMSDLSFGAFTYVLQSLQLIVTEKIIWAVSFTVETVCIILFLWQGYGIYALLWAFAIRIAISIALSTYIAKKQLPSIAIRLRYFSFHMLKHFLHFGGIVQLAGLLGIANRSIKKVLAGSFLGLEATGLYEVGEKFPVMSLNLPGSVTAVFLPATAQFHATAQEEKIIQVYVKGSRLINLLTASMMGFMAAFSVPLINAWLGLDPLFDVAASILTWFTFAYQMDTLTGPVSAIYRSINQPQKELLYGFLQLGLTICAVLTGIYFYGASFFVINATISAAMVISASYYLYVSNLFFGISHDKYFRSVILPGLYPYFIAFALWLLFKPFFLNLTRWENLWLFLVAFICYLAIWIPLLFWGVLSKIERYHLTARLLNKLK